ncbi:hypothetical protein [Paenibacillus xylanexedens]|uniref:hypothetical protein n=1 Tax=Paenibacillus xylanexedens TaxID=528191 RepID=UPI003D03608A
MAVGLQVLLEDIGSVFQGTHDFSDIIAVYKGIFCAVVMYLVYRYNKKLAPHIKRQAVMAAARNNIYYAWVSAGAIVSPWRSIISEIPRSKYAIPNSRSIRAAMISLSNCAIPKSL